MPVIETGVGNCHVYVDAAADLDRALAIVLNSKTQRTSVCNAAESLLVHEAVAADVPAPGRRRRSRRPASRSTATPPSPATPGWWRPPTRTGAPSTSRSTSPPRSCPTSTPRSTTSTATRSGHSDAIVTEDQRGRRRFVAEVDAAAVLVNASTRFTDGGEFGFGAEIGISTQKLHARGPMGLPEMTTTKYVVTGEGHVR